MTGLERLERHSGVFVERVVGKLSASQLHYALCAIGTVTLIARYAIGKEFDAGYATWLTAFWVAAIGGDRLNTPNPNLSSNNAG